MKNTFIILTLSILLSIQVNAKIATNSKIKAAYAIGIFHENKKGENVQHVRRTKEDYNNTCYSKIVVFTNLTNLKTEVKIGNSIGTLINTRGIYNKYKIKIAQEQTFKHFNVTKGYMEVRVNNKLYDSKVFVK